MKNLLTRSISALIYACIFLSAIIFSSETYIGLITIFATISLWEYSKLIRSTNILPYLTLFALSILAYHGKITGVFELVILGLNLITNAYLFLKLFSKEPHKYSPLLKLNYELSYVVLSFIFLILIPFINGSYHPDVMLFIILIIWTNDSFAFLVGKNFGRTKLFERISPKKTIEGFIGGLVFSVLVGFIIGKFDSELNSMNWIIIALIVSIFGTYGDLIESKFKRHAKVKDSGTIMPGHGGLLDRLDSLFFLAPFVYLYIHFLM